MTGRKPAILFVDDDMNILVGLRRMLHGQRAVWDMSFAANAPEAFALLEQQPFDIVVSDMRMPDLDGADLLSRVEKKNPSTVRIILSGYSEASSILRATGTAHQYMAKPCNPDVLVDIVRRALALRQVLADGKLRQLVTSLHGLPTPSPLYRKVMEEINSETSSAAAVAALVSSDVAMTASLLKLTNSAFFSASGRAATPLQAVRMLGMETVRALVMTTGLFHPFAGKASLAPLLDRLNRHSLLVAHLARDIAATLSLGPMGEDQAFCAGMMSQIGTLVLLDGLPRRLAQALARVGEGVDLRQAQMEVFGSSYAELGAYLLGLWGFPTPLIEAVIWQYQPGQCGVSLQSGVLTALHVASALAPPFPLLPPAVTAPAVILDTACLEKASLLSLLPEWERLSRERQFAEAS